MATKRLPSLPFLPPVPATITPQYASAQNLAINSFYRNIVQSVDELLITATSTAAFPAAKGFKRLAFDGSKLYIDWNTTSWTPVAPSSAFQAGMSTTGGGGSAGSTGFGAGSLWLFPGSGITMSGATAANAYNLTISGPTIPAATTLALAVSGNTAGTASTYTAGTAILSAGAGITISEGNQTLSILGNTVTVNTIKNSSLFIPTFEYTTAASAGPGIGFPQFAQFQCQNSFAWSSLDCFFSIGQATAVGSSQARFLTISAGVYNQAEPMTQIASTSSGLAWTATGATFSGTSVKVAVLPWTTSLPPGDYVMAFWTSSSSSGNALAVTQSQIMASWGSLAFGGNITSSTSSASNQAVRFFAQATASTTGFPVSFSASTLNGTASSVVPYLLLRGVARV